MSNRNGTSKAKLALIASASVVLLAGCASNGSNSSSNSSNGTQTASPSGDASSSQPEPVALTVLNRDSMATPGHQQDRVTKEIEKQTGTSIDLQSYDEKKLQVMIASGDLPDVMLVPKNYADQMLKANEILPLDDLLQSNGKDIAANAPDMLSFSKKYLSNGTDKTYFLLDNVGPALQRMNNDFISWMIRWDYYKELGYPEAKSTDDVLNIMAEMQAKHPTTDDGKKTYALGGWNDWGIWNIATTAAIFGPTGRQPNGIVEYGGDYTASDMLTDDHSAFWTAMKFWNEAYQKGLVDPETFTQKFDNYEEKMKNQQYLSTYASFLFNGGDKAFVAKGQADRGWEPLPPVSGFQFNNNFSSVGSSNQIFVISKNAKNPQKAMDFINYFYTVDGSRITTAGVKDVDWVLDGGKPVLTEEFVKARDTDPKFDETVGVNKWEAFQGLSWGTNAPDGGTIFLYSKNELAYTGMSALDKAYSDHYGVDHPGGVQKKMADEGKLTYVNQDNGPTLLIPTPSDDINRINSSLSDYLNKSWAKIIMAKSDDEFTKRKADALSDMKKLGLQKALDFYLPAWKKAIDDYKAMVK